MLQSSMLLGGSYKFFKEEDAVFLRDWNQSCVLVSRNFFYSISSSNLSHMALLRQRMQEAVEKKIIYEISSRG